MQANQWAAIRQSGKLVGFRKPLLPAGELRIVALEPGEAPDREGALYLGMLGLRELPVDVLDNDDADAVDGCVFALEIVKRVSDGSKLRRRRG
jgi:hypothetical protein